MLKTIPWNLVNIKVLGVETQHAGEEFDGSEEEIKQYMKVSGYNITTKLGYDMFFVKM